MTRHPPESALPLLRHQRSHLLFVLSQPEGSHESVFLKWYQGAYREQLSGLNGVLSIQQYKRHEVDITQGRYPPLPFEYLAVCELSIGGSEEAEGLIETITEWHHRQAVARTPATWLYYPACEQVGRPLPKPCMRVLAFANGTPGEEDAFREWYATRHIRHALHLPVLVSGQCFERTQFQRAGALEAKFSTIAMYDFDADTPQAFFDAVAALPPGTLPFPMLDRSRFAEALYQPV